MSIIVKGLNAPERCETCTMVACYRNSGSIWCNAMNRRLVPDWDGDTEVEIDVPEWCPIIEVTGPLIDRKELEKSRSENVYCTESAESQMIIARREKPMTIEETMEALRCCIVIDCPPCPLFGAEEACKGTLVREARDTIKRLREENSALKTELRVNLGNPYWVNICKMNARQESKGMEKYGEPLEENTTLTTVQRIEHAQEEAIDLLKYLEHLKQVADDGITANDYQRAAMRTDNKNQTEEERMLDALFGLCGEAGEVMDAYKKYRFQGHESYKDEMIIECSDLLWYAAKLADVLGVTLGEVMERNIEKLKKRFPDGFDKARSINRKENAE